MANYKTGAQRYNDRMHDIFEKAKKDWPTSGLHGPSKEDVDNRSEAMKKSMAKKMKKNLEGRMSSKNQIKNYEKFKKHHDDLMKYETN